jgi:hypothetical protein
VVSSATGTSATVSVHGAIWDMAVTVKDTEVPMSQLAPSATTVLPTAKPAAMKLAVAVKVWLVLSTEEMVIMLDAIALTCAGPTTTVSPCVKPALAKLAVATSVFELPLIEEIVITLEAIAALDPDWST